VIHDSSQGASDTALRLRDNHLGGTDGNFYGTTSGPGTIFKITPTGTLTPLYSLAPTDGAGPNKLVQATNGTFYGTTLRGGKIVYHYCGGSCGTIFSLSVQ
jgi:uncharacterized repeat protein (TIGR03803 family)